jgi:signal transduction histidine kinase
VHRLVQEALHNVVKHAEATHVSISMERLDAETVVVIEGNGAASMSPSQLNVTAAAWVS